MNSEELDTGGRMETLGNLTAGVIHDFNNILATISGFAELIAASIGEAGEPIDAKHVAVYARYIIQAAALGKTTVQELQSFARPDGAKPESIDLHALLSQSVAMARGAMQGNISFKVEFRAEAAIVQGCRGPLYNAFLNLFLNARDAMPTGGRITVRTWLQKRESTSSIDRSENLVISIRDTGTGISKEVMGKIFNPFFTTKGRNGNGLGLANALATFEAHAGTIAVSSPLGRGTEFRIMIPLESGTSAS